MYLNYSLYHRYHERSTCVTELSVSVKVHKITYSNSRCIYIIVYYLVLKEDT